MDLFAMKAPVLHDSKRFAVLAADVVIFTVRDRELCVRLMRVQRPPHFPDNAGFPGALVAADESAEDTALRIVRDRGVIASPIHIEQLYTMSRIDRDPRGRVVAVAYLALVPWETLTDTEKADTTNAWWEPVSNLSDLSRSSQRLRRLDSPAPIALGGRLAYDHDELLDIALKRLRSRVTYTTLMLKLMPTEFTLTELEHAYESILKTDLDKRNFRKKLQKLKLLTRLPKKRTGGKFRPAQLYAFSTSKVKDIEVL